MKRFVEGLDRGLGFPLPLKIEEPSSEPEGLQLLPIHDVIFGT